MTRPTVGQPLDTNPNGWTGPWHRPTSGADYVRDTGLAAEDWNFALEQAVVESDGTWLYGYGQGRVSEARVGKAPDGFDVLFYHRLPNGTFRAAGLYLAAEYIHEDDAADAWVKLEEAGHVKTRLAQLGLALVDDPKKAKLARAELKKGGHLRWRVRLENVVVFDPQPVISPKRPTDHRHTNAYDWTDHAWSEVVVVLPEVLLQTIEGKLITAAHRARERSAAFRSAVLTVRKERMAHGASLCCEACQADLGKLYGPALQDFVEAHHTIPLHTFAAHGGKVTEHDIALLCPNCHRVAHRTGRWTVGEIKQLLAANGTHA